MLSSDENSDRHKEVLMSYYCWFFEKFGVKFSIVCRKFCGSLLKSWVAEKEVIQCFDIKKPQIQIGLSVSKKLCLNLCSLK